MLINNHCKALDNGTKCFNQIWHRCGMLEQGYGGVEYWDGDNNYSFKSYDSKPNLHYTYSV